MNRTNKDATVNRFRYDSHDQLRRHLRNLLMPTTSASPKTLKGLTPHEIICQRWTSEPDRFIIEPIHEMPGLNIQL